MHYKLSEAREEAKGPSHEPPAVFCLGDKLRRRELPLQSPVGCQNLADWV